MNINATDEVLSSIEDIVDEIIDDLGGGGRLTDPYLDAPKDYGGNWSVVQEKYGLHRFTPDTPLALLALYVLEKRLEAITEHDCKGPDGCTTLEAHKPEA